MSGDSNGSTNAEAHPARKIDKDELKQLIAERRDVAPVLTTSMVNMELPDAGQQAIRDNLNALADEGELCRANDGNVNLYWIPRKTDTGGDVVMSDILNPSMDYNRIDPSQVPTEIAEQIAESQLPYYSKQTFWSMVSRWNKTGIIIALGFVILGIAGSVSETANPINGIAIPLLNWGFDFGYIFIGLYAASQILHLLSTEGYVPESPLSMLRE
jgi:hypothetical protein